MTNYESPSSSEYKQAACIPVTSVNDAAEQKLWPGVDV